MVEWWHTELEEWNDGIWELEQWNDGILGKTKA